MISSTQVSLGTKCHFVNGQIPVAVLTDINGNIIVGNELIDESAPDIRYGVPQSTWVVSGMRTMKVRFFSASTASIVLTCALPDAIALPPSLPKEIGIEREICIWVGYIESVRPVTQQDLAYGRLLRDFLMVVDTISAVGSASGGYTCKIDGRCRMKWLMDSTVFYNQAEIQKNGESIARSDLLLQIAQRAIGQVEEEGCSNCGKEILKSNAYTIDIAKGDIPEADIWYKNDGPLINRMLTSLNVDPNPEFRIFTARTEIETNKSQDFILNNQIPVEMIKTLSSQDVYPTEMFMHHRDGHFYYVPRCNDISGLEDPARFFRTYYFKVSPEGVQLNPNQRLLAFKEERSSVALKTNLIIEKADANQQNTAHAEWSLHLRVRPHSLRGVPMACKFMRLGPDATINTVADAAVVALSAARFVSKDVRAGMAVLLGDPSIMLGETIQMLGSPLTEYNDKSLTQLAAADREKFLEYNKRWASNLVDYAKLTKTTDPSVREVELTAHDGAKVKFDASADANENATQFICKTSSFVGADENNIGFNEDVQTMWRVEGILNKFNLGGKGFTTELALVSPF